MPDKKIAKKNNDYIIGRNAVNEAFNSGRIIDKIYASNGRYSSGALKSILARAKDSNVVIKEVSKSVLDHMSGGENHQGIIAISGAKKCVNVEDILNYARSKNESPFILIADGIEDPHNLGAIIRTAECFSVHGIIIPKHSSVGIVESVGRASAGALEHMMVAKVGNLSVAIENLKRCGLWIYGADMTGKSVYDCKFSGAIGLVIGSEGSGIRKLVKDKCDFLLSIPMSGKINSLNASVAAGILMYEIRKQISTI